MQEIPFDLLTKYNVAIPRYTSYPTVPFWEENIDAEHWKLLFTRRFNESNTQEGISLYIHLPYCESLCTFCGCNKRITANHSVEKEYIDSLIKEWNLYKILMGKNPVIREFHIGGGTPTFFSPENLTQLLQAILKDSIVPEEHEFGFEGHPNNTTKAHLKMFRSFGFNRVSFGNNQDYRRCLDYQAGSNCIL
jgi:oxygen-independent coproporphyrinogen-3 oxidase